MLQSRDGTTDSINTRGPFEYPSRFCTPSRRSRSPNRMAQFRAALAPLRSLYGNLSPAGLMGAGEGGSNEHSSNSSWRLVHWRGGTRSRSRGCKRSIWFSDSGRKAEAPERLEIGGDADGDGRPIAAGENQATRRVLAACNRWVSETKMELQQRGGPWSRVWQLPEHSWQLAAQLVRLWFASVEVVQFCVSSILICPMWNIFDAIKRWVRMCAFSSASSSTRGSGISDILAGWICPSGL